jgi:ectoine hydroxylase-related dioxygenase (phytanoyl-CoA dioxygenase family)
MLVALVLNYYAAENRRIPMKTQQQYRRFFSAFGYALFRKLFSPQEMALLSAEFDACMGSKHGSGASKRRRLTRLLMDADSPELASLAIDRRLCEVSSVLLGRPTICIQVAGTHHAGDTQWHSDNLNLPYKGVKFLMYLDPLNATTGALRVMPGSHRQAGRGDRLMCYDSLDSFGLTGGELPAQVIPTRPGDVVAFAHPLWHASFNGRHGRRMVEINFYADPRSAVEERAFCAQMQMNHRAARDAGVRMYPRSWRESEHPDQSRWIHRLAALGVLDPPSAKIARGRNVDMQPRPPKPPL